MTQTGQSGPAYRPDIDGLRALAVLAVVGFHATPRFVPGGYVGVDVFFVISGFLISGIVIAQLSEGHFTFADFYARRIRRIFPSLIVVLLACAAIGWFVLVDEEFAQLLKHIAASAVFVPNVVFPTGVVQDRDALLVYYGAADAVTAVAEFSLGELLGAMTGPG